MKPTRITYKLGMLAVVLGALILATGLGRAANDDDYQYMNEYPLPAGVGAPEDIVAAGNGDLWFTLRNGSSEVGRLVVTAAPDVFNFTFYELPDGSQAGDITFAGGFAWVTIPARNSVLRLPPVAGQDNEWALPASSQPAGIAVAPSGNLWIAAPGTNHILRFNPATKAVTAYLYNEPGAGIANVTVYQDDAIFFTAKNLNKVVRLIPSRYPVNAYTSIPLSDPRFGSIGQPGQVAINNSNHLWVVAAERNWLGFFIPGTFTYWSWKVVAPEGIEPFGLALSRMGSVNLIWYTLPEAGRVGHLGQDAGGDLFRRAQTIPSAGSVPRSIAVDSANHGWIAVAGSNLIAEWIPPYNDTVSLPLFVNNNP